jgi:hypothetical protein
VRHLNQSLKRLWRKIAPPAQGRHIRLAPPAASRQPDRRLRVRQHRLIELSPFPAPTAGLPSAPPADPPLDRGLVPRYYRAWEKEREARRIDQSRLGVGVLKEIAKQVPQARSGDLLLTTGESWRTPQGVRV